MKLKPKGELTDNIPQNKQIIKDRLNAIRKIADELKDNKEISEDNYQRLIKEIEELHKDLDIDVIIKDAYDYENNKETKE